MTSSERRTWETRLMRAAGSEPGRDMPVAERVAVQFLRSDDPELDLHSATVWAELVAADVPAEDRVGFARMWMCELRDALRRGHPDQGSGDTT
ncbi:hypothetical protein [Mycobacteroides abscessus]|uniref:hypothetical protein n=1 Tax=Mycobacteroides abscessus TaxID=36809 RepID=UPI000E677305|nr:hypothetical protein [Mycobacteroides abscessus]RIS51959.1 hypothetical protein D2E46_24175 [Mycobacteroides abscessus]